MCCALQIRGMHTIIRDRDTKAPDFVFYADRLLRLVRTLCCCGWSRRCCAAAVSSVRG